MSISIKYRELFTVEFVHDYFTDTAARGLEAVPTQACERLLAGSKLVAKAIGNTLRVFSPESPANTPLVAPPSPSAFSFLVRASSPDLYAITNLKGASAGSGRFFFSNLTETRINGKTYLHSAPTLFDATLAYELGDIVRNNASACFECLVHLAPNSSALADPAQWRPLSGDAYAGAGHLIACVGETAVLPVAPAAADVTYGVFGFNAATGLFDIPIRSDTVHATPPLTEVAIALTGIEAGRYRIRVNAVDHIVYYCPEGDWNSFLGVIEVHHHDALAANDRLVRLDGTFNSPVFTVRFAAGSHLWQYVARTTAVQRVYDETAAITFESAGPRTFRSTVPVPAREAAYDKITIEFNNTNPVDPSKKIDIRKAPVPSVTHLRSAVKNGTEYLVSEIQLTY